MKIPNKKQLHITDDSTMLEMKEDISSDDLRKIATLMDKENIFAIRLTGDYDGYVDCTQIRFESKDEARVRYLKEVKSYDKWKIKDEERKEKRKKKLIQEASKLGLTLREES